MTNQKNRTFVKTCAPLAGYAPTQTAPRTFAHASAKVTHQFTVAKVSAMFADCAKTPLAPKVFAPTNALVTHSHRINATGLVLLAESV